MTALKVVKSEYDIAGEEFLASTGTTFEALLVGHDKFFPGDKDARDIYQITFKRKGRKDFTLRFGQSLANSGRGLLNARYSHTEPLPKEARDLLYSKTIAGERNGYIKSPFGGIQKTRKAPTAYDVLACLTKYDPGSFDDFCDDFGYSNDSRTAERTYLAVTDEWSKVQKMFGDVLQQLQQIS